MNRTIRNVLFGGTPLASTMAEVGELILRLFAGLSLALAHGLGKMPPTEGFISGVGKLGFPAPTFFAWMAGLSEFAGGILLALGLFTRPAAFCIAFTMGTAAFLQHRNDLYQVKELALMYLAIALFFLLKGAGRISADAFLRKN